MQTARLPDVSSYLIYAASGMDPASPLGCWVYADIGDIEVAPRNNAVFLPEAWTPEDLLACRRFFESFKVVLVLGGDEQQRNAAATAIQTAAPGVPVCVTPQSAYLGYASLTEMYCEMGAVDYQSHMAHIWEEAYELPPYGIVEVASVDVVDISKQPHTKSGIPALDSMIGGLYDGEVSVWTGKRKEGKSTMLGLPILAALKAGRKVCVYSGELPTWRYKAWLVAMAAGPDHLIEERTDTGKVVWSTRPEIAKQIDIWWAGRLFQFDNSLPGIHRPETLLSMMRYAHRRYGCSVFVVDNLMTVDLSGEDYYRAQSRFTGQLVDFAHETNAHVHLVAHRRKGGTVKGAKGDSDDVSGSGDITNRADNTFCVSRTAEGESPFDSTLEVLANRDFGATGVIGMKFDTRSRRYYSQNVNWTCGWEKACTELPQQSIFYELQEDDPDDPFKKEVV